MNRLFNQITGSKTLAEAKVDAIAALTYEDTQGVSLEMDKDSGKWTVTIFVFTEEEFIAQEKFL